MSRSTRLLSLVLALGSAAAVGAQSSACVQTPADRKANNNFMWWQREGTENYKKLWRLFP